MKSLAVATALLSAAAFADVVEPGYGSSPRNMMIEARIGPIYPLIDRAFPNEIGPYEQIFGNSSMLMAGLEIERQVFQKFGSLAIGISVSYAEKFGQTQLANGASSGESTGLRILPMKALLVYRFDYLSIRWGIPLVPYVKGGLALTYWWTSKGTVTETFDGTPGIGWSYGYTGAIGLSFLLDILDPRLARDFDTGVGVNHSYIFAEFNADEVNDFGRSTASGKPYALDLSARYPMFGLAFEF